MQATKNPERVVDYIPGNYEDASPAELVKLIQPYLEDWQKVKEKELMLQLENARNAGKCSYGIEDVYKAARRKKGKLLIVEKNFQVSDFMKNGLLNPEMNAAPSNTAYINDAVDEVIEKVLDQGGDVSMVREGLLEKFGRIALIRYY
jgi:peptide subunit release factor 1 (eRF1)